MFSRALVACLLAAVLCGCGAGAALFGPSTGTVTGHVQIRACGGANQGGQTSCPTSPYAGVTLTFALTPPAGTGSRNTATTDANGAYRIALPPGTYTVTAAQPSASVPRPKAFSGPPAVVAGFLTRQIIVTAGKTLTADFAYVIELL